MHVKDKFEAAIRKAAQWSSRRYLSQQTELWPALQKYLADTKSTGCGWIDYAALYREVRTRQPREVLECGTGVSTLVIAQALIDNQRQGGVAGRVTSMEEHAEWFSMASKLLPQQYREVVDLQLSPTVEDRFSMFRGVRYRDLPDRRFDFVFVDGPSYYSPEDGTPTFDFDLLRVILASDTPVAALIDKRVSTCFVLQQLLGADKVQYKPIQGLGFVAPCTRHDLGRLSEQLSSENFARSFRLLGATRLHLDRRQDLA